MLLEKKKQLFKQLCQTNMKTCLLLYVFLLLTSGTNGRGFHVIYRSVFELGKF